MEQRLRLELDGFYLSMTIIDAWLHPATVRDNIQTEYNTGSNDKSTFTLEDCFFLFLGYLNLNI